MGHQVNDVIPVGVGTGVVTLIANRRGLDYLPPSAVVGDVPGGGGYYDITIPVQDDVDAVAARLLGVSVGSILQARDNARREGV